MERTCATCKWKRGGFACPKSCWICQHPDVGVDRSTGELVTNIYCKDERNNGVCRRGHCGPDGLKWEEKIWFWEKWFLVK